MTNPTQPTPETVTILILPNGREFRLDVLNSVEQAIPTLAADRTYTLRKMCGPDVWSRLSPREKIEHGEVFAALVTVGAFPLEFACCPHRSNKRYRLKESFLHVGRLSPVIKTHRN